MNNYKNYIKNYLNISQIYLLYPNLNFDKINWNLISKNAKLSDNFIEKWHNKLILSFIINLSDNLKKKFINFSKGDLVYELITNDFKNNNFIRYHFIQYFPNILEKYIKQNILSFSEIERKEILSIPYLSEKIILNFLKTKKNDTYSQDEENILILSKQNLSESFIKNNFNIFDYISQIISRQKISEKFIYDNYFNKQISLKNDYTFWKKLLKNNRIKISEKFILENMNEKVQSDNLIIKLIFYQTNIELSDNYIIKYINGFDVYDILTIYEMRRFSYNNILIINLLKNINIFANLYWKFQIPKISEQLIFELIEFHIKENGPLKLLLQRLIINNKEFIDKILIKYDKNLDDETIFNLLYYSDTFFDKYKLRIEKYFFDRYIYSEKFNVNNIIYKIFNGDNCECDKLKFLFDKNIEIDWNYITNYYILNDFTINKYFNKINLENIRFFEEISEDFIEKWSEKLNWEQISLKSKYRENIKFIEKWHHKINFNILVRKNANLTNIIIKYYEKINFDYINLIDLNPEIIKLYKNQITDDKWNSIISSIILTPEFIKNNKEIIIKFAHRLFINESLTNEIICEIFQN